MRAAVMYGDIVANVIEVESLDIFPNLLDGATANIGDRRIGGIFVPQSKPKSDDEHDAPILAELHQIDLDSIRPLREDDKAALTALNVKAALLRAKLKKPK